MVPKTLEYTMGRGKGVKRTTYAGIVFIVLVVLLGLYYFNKEENLTPPAEVAVEQKPVSNISFEGSSIVERQGGKKIWELSAGTIQVDQTTNKVYFNNFTGILYQNSGGELHLTAKEAWFDNNTKELSINGDIKAVSSDGANFSAQQAQWFGKEDKIYAEGGIVLQREDTVITGDTLESDASLTKVKIQGNAHVRKGE
ncbi:MAG: hypothetical protein H6Q75_1750 [Firmicutes bacterium]|nr:hypothetical protein [Bacillota bacterium]